MSHRSYQFNSWGLRLVKIHLSYFLRTLVLEYCEKCSLAQKKWTHRSIQQLKLCLLKNRLFFYNAGIPVAFRLFYLSQGFVFCFPHLQDVFWCACNTMHIALAYWPRQYVCFISGGNMWSVLVEEIRIYIRLRDPGKTALSYLISVATPCAETRHWNETQQSNRALPSEQTLTIGHKKILSWLNGQKYLDLCKGF